MTIREEIKKQASIYTDDASTPNGVMVVQIVTIQSLLKKHLSKVLNGLTTIYIYFQYGMI